MNKQRLLIVEDEPAIQAGLIDVFTYHGYAVEAVADGGEGLARARSGEFDLIILDVMLPGMNGFDVCEAIRARDRTQPIIMLTARVSDDDIINGLTLGADDYIAKPFGVQELVLRVGAVLRRADRRGDSLTRIDLADGKVIDCDNLEGRINDARVSFTAREMDILKYLAAHHERAVSRDELLTEVWGFPPDAAPETRTVDIHVAKLRRKLETDARDPVSLITVRGAGYRLVLASDV